VNGAPVISGSPSGNIALNPAGTTTINLLVTAQDGTTKKSYAIVVPKSGSNNANLSSLSLSTGSGLITSTGKANVNYTTTVAQGTGSLAVKPTTADPNATVTVNGDAVKSGSYSGIIDLSPKSVTIINIVVTAQDGSTIKSYAITVPKSASNNANLSSLSLSTGSALVAATGPSNVNYISTVAHGTASLTVTPTVADPNATVIVNGISVKSGSSSGTINLDPKSVTIINLMVTAQDGSTKKSYTIVIPKSSSNNANLSSLSLSTGNALVASTGKSNVNYTTTVPKGTGSLTVTPTAADPNATITVNGVIVKSGSSSATINLSPNVVTIINVLVTAQDGSTKKSYAIVVPKSSSNNANLSSLSLSTGSALVASNGKSNVNYTTTVPKGTGSLTVTPTAADPNATITVNGVIVKSGSSSATINLSPNVVTIINILVTAQDGSTKKSYAIVVPKSSSNIPSLAALKVHTSTSQNSTGYPNKSVSKSNIFIDNATITNNTQGPVLTTNGTSTSLNPGEKMLKLDFDPATFNYNISVGDTISAISIAPLSADTNATITVNGNPVQNGRPCEFIPLNAGNNTITTVVTAQDGITTQEYKITISKQASALASNANLIALNPSNGTLTPAFDSKVKSYTISVANNVAAIFITPKASDPNAAISVNLNTVQNGAPSTPIALASGNNTITTEVIAQDGITKQTYTISVNRQETVLTSEPGADSGGDKLIVHQAVSPNGDGVNDFLMIEGIENYSNNKVSIINQNGVMIYDVNNYNNNNRSFNGYSNLTGVLQQPGTYFYLINYTVNGEARRKTGFFVLKY
jgi:gliding motility-associated-like protein